MKILSIPWREFLFSAATIGSLATPCIAQSDGLVVGDQWVDLLSAQPTLTTAGLPTSTGADRYNGDPTARSQVVRTDGNGHILFFAIDGNVYDADGYQIARAVGTTDCTECLHPGEMEMLAVPVPGNCDLFYLFTSNATIPIPGSYNATPRVQVSLLDMGAPNRYWPERSGRIMEIFNEVEVEGHPELNDLATYLEPAANSSTEGPLFPAWLPVYSLIAKCSSPMIRIIDPTGTGQTYFLYHILKDRVFPYKITSTGIYPVPTAFQNGIMTYFNNDPVGNKSSTRDADVAMGPGGEIMLAMTDEALVEQPIPNAPGGASTQLMIMRFNAITGAYQDVHGFQFDGTDPNLPVFETATSIINTPTGYWRGSKGCAIISNGNKVFMTGLRLQDNSWLPTVGAFDLNTNAWTDLMPLTDPINGFYLISSRIYRNIDPATNKPTVYIPQGNGMAAFIGTDDISTMTFEPLANGSNGSHPPQYVPPFVTILNEFPPVFLNAQPTNEHGAESLALVTEGECCTFREGSSAKPSRTVTGNEYWSPTNNPFGSATEVRMAGTLVVESGASLNISNMTFRFAPHARIIVKRGGKLTTSYSTLTSYVCTDARWPGVIVEGNAANTYQVDNPGLPIDAEQGRFYMLPGSVIENAFIGVWCTREVSIGTQDANYNGGWVRAYSSTFRNCVYGVRLQSYHRFDANTPSVGPELPNRTYIYNCTFETTASWPSWDPYWHIRLDDVRHVQIKNCRFRNEVPGMFAYGHNGGGIELNGAIAYVDGDGDQSNSYFQKLYRGVTNNGSVLSPVRISKMHFDNNEIGIDDRGSRLVEYGENTFSIPDDTYGLFNIGMRLWQTQLMTVERNTFNGIVANRNIGIQFVGYTAEEATAGVYTENKIYNNTFTNLLVGCLVDRVHVGDGYGGNIAGLQLLCGDYTDNAYDIAMMDQTLIRPNQGRAGQLAGNRFYNEANCSSNYDWFLDADWNNIPGWTTFEITYLRNEEPEGLVGVTCDSWVDYVDVPLPQSGTFDKVSNCGNGVYPIMSRTTQLHEVAYRDAKYLLSSALATYEGTVDLGETPDLKEAIDQSTPWLSSSYLRDLLLSKNPLSDEILVKMLKREVPMDQWHLTQVLLQNSKLNPGVHRSAIEMGTLSPFFLAMVDQAQQGNGISTKQVLEQEIVQRRLEMTEELAVLGHLYARDTVGTPTDSLEKLMLYDKDKQFLMQRVEALIKLERYAEAQALLDGKLEGVNGKEVMEDLLAMQQSTNGNWEDLNQVDKGKLYDHALSGKAGAAQASGILLALETDAPEPPVRLPNTAKSRTVRKPRTSSATSAMAVPTMACFPNPSNTSTFLTYPAEMDGTVAVVYDAKGATVYKLTLQGNGLAELDSRVWPEGMYQVVLPGSPFNVKLSVQH